MPLESPDNRTNAGFSYFILKREKYSEIVKDSIIEFLIIRISIFYNLRKYPFGNFKSYCETSLKNILKIKIPNDGAFGGENKLKEGFSSSEMGFVISGLRDFLTGLMGTTKFNSGTRSSEILIFGTVTERLVLHGLAKK